MKLVDSRSIPGRTIKADGRHDSALSIDIDRATGNLARAESKGTFDLLHDIPDAPPIPASLTRNFKIAPRP